MSDNGVSSQCSSNVWDPSSPKRRGTVAENPPEEKADFSSFDFSSFDFSPFGGPFRREINESFSFV